MEYNEVNLTLKLPLLVGEKDVALLTEVRRQFTRSYNNVCKVAWKKKIRTLKNLHHEVYYPEKEKHDLPSQAIINVTHRSLESVKSVRDRISKGKRGTCPESRGLGVRYDHRNYTLHPESREISITTLKEKGRSVFSFKVPEYYEEVLENLHSKRCEKDCYENGKCFKTTTVEVIKKGNRFFLHLSVKRKFEILDPKKLKSFKVVGVDLGVSRPAVTSENRFLCEARDRDLENKVLSLVSELQSKGTKSAKKKLKKKSGGRRRFQRDRDHVLVNEILASVEKGDILVLEDLTNIRDRVRAGKAETRRRIHSWSFAQFKTFLEYKAAMKGVRVIFIDPAYTSQECSRCGHTERANRPHRSWFRCKDCGFQLDADLNASRNIRCRGVEVLLLEGVAPERMRRVGGAKCAFSGPQSTGPSVSPTSLFSGELGRDKPCPSGHGG